MANSKIPILWAEAALGEVCSVVQGQSPPSKTYNTEGKGLPFLQGKAEFGTMYPEVIKWCSVPKKIAEPGDVLISVRAPVGPTNLCAVRSCIGRGLAAIRTRANMPSKFFLYALRASEEELRSKSTGTTFQAIRGDDLRSHQIGLPPLPEQRRIVAEIEKQFTRLDAAESALRRVEVNLKRYRASVLKAACEGKLVPTEAELAEAEGRDYEHAEQLLERILVERRAQWESQEKRRGKYKEPILPDTPDSPELPKGWVWASIDQLILKSPQNGIYKPKSLYGDGVPILRIEDYQDFHVRTHDQLQRLRITTEEASTYRLAASHLIINRVNSPSHLGKTLLVPDHFTPAVFESNMMRVIPSRFMASPFLAHYLRSPEGRGRLTSHAKWAVNQASINQSDVCTTSVPVPPLHEQHRIIAEIERSLSMIQQFATAVEASLKRIERLRQSILKRAFCGQLVPQDPDDEPASILLERIHAERAAATTPAPQRRKSRRRTMSAADNQLHLLESRP